MHNYESLQLEYDHTLLTITINRPDSLNALNNTVLRELEALLQDIQSGDQNSIRAIILTGAGNKAFVAGADIKAMSLLTELEALRFGALGQKVTRLLETIPQPVIACVAGYALGGGCELALSCDWIYATDNAVFGQPEINLGLIPGFGGTVRLQKYVGLAKARELIYTGRMLHIDEAQTIGLINERFDSKEAMLSAAATTLKGIASKSSLIIKKCKAVINATHGVDIGQGLEIERNNFAAAFTTEDTREGLTAFVERRKPLFKGR